MSVAVVRASLSDRGSLATAGGERLPAESSLNIHEGLRPSVDLFSKVPLLRARLPDGRSLAIALGKRLPAEGSLVIDNTPRPSVGLASKVAMLLSECKGSRFCIQIPADVPEFV